ncbi:paramyosin [Caerostris extrusa]|uniref:Paramyosin n=1 Tax=Caerostris extrusa TaxID=172846 RepID=A0AAV4PSZ0_CAEEX|nr:paramyosin [Caerostris extrusa]
MSFGRFNQEIQNQLNEVNKWVHDAETKLKSEIVSNRSKIQSELSEVTSILDETAKYSDDLHRVIRKQAKQISSLNNQYDDINRHLVDISDVLEKSRVRCQSLQSDLSSIQTVLEVKTHRI